MLNKYWKTVRSITLVIALGCGTAVAQDNLKPAGMAAYTETARDIYIAALLLPAGTTLDNVYLAPGPKAMEYRISTRRVSSRSFAGTLLIQGEMGSGSRPPEAAAKALGDVKERMKGAMLKGDSFVITLSADEVTSFYMNGTELLTVEDGEVFDFFFAGWVGESSSALLRGELLAGKIDPTVRNRHAALAPSTERQAEIASWMEPEPEPVIEARQVAVAKVAVPASTPIPAPETKTTVQMLDTKEAVQLADNIEASAPVDVEVTAATTDTVPEPVVDDVVAPTVVAVSTAAAPTAAVSTAAVSTAAATAAVSPTPALDVKVEVEPDKELIQLASMGSTSGLLEPDDDKQYQMRLSKYIGDVMVSVFGNVNYPRRAVKKNREGKVQLLARLDATGELLDITLDDSSGYSMLDEAAEKAVRKAAPFPELPQEAREEFVADDGESYLVMIPVTFRLQN